MGQHPPGATAPSQVEDGVDDLTEGVGPGPAGAAVALREEVLDIDPLEVGQVAGISLPGRCGAHIVRVTVGPGPAEDRFLDGH